MIGGVVRLAKPLVGASLIALTIGCASTPAATYQTAVASRPLPPGNPAAVGEARASEGVRNAKVSLRGASMTASSKDQTFSGYIREALIAELSASGRYSADAARRIDLALVKHEVDASGIKEGEAEIAIRLTVREGAQQRFEKTYESRHAWPSSFIGAVAIPAAFDNYPTAVQKLLVEVMSDPEFQAAIE